MKLRFLCLGLALALLAGCDLTPGPGAGRVEEVPDIPGEVEIPALTGGEGAEEGYRAFSLSLLYQCRREGKNTLVSPLSAAMALGMTANGAGGETLEEFRAMFGMDLDTLNAFSAALLGEYAALGGSTEAALANSLWCDPEVALEDLFAARCRQNYNAQLFMADLQSPGTVRALNDWVKEATRGLIPSVAEGFSPDTVVALVNALYLKNAFQTPFRTPEMEWSMDFTAQDGTVSRPLGMSTGERLDTILWDKKGTGVVLPYDDGRLGLLLMLPDRGVTLTEYLDTWSAGTVKTLLEKGETRLAELVVPKFELTWEGSLADALEGMGLTAAFSPTRADFSGLGSCGDSPLFIGDVIHKTALKVNEKGTEAAAVTAVMMNAGAAMPPEDLVVLVFDRPFLLGIVDLERGIPLFLGTVEDLRE